MSFVKLNVFEGNKSVELEVEAATPQHIDSIIVGTFGIFGITQQPEITVDLGGPVLIKADNASSADLKEKQHREVQEAKSTIQQPVTAQVIPPANTNIQSKKVELQGANRTLNTSIGEKLDKAIAEAPEKPDWYDTGIKFKDEVPHYRLRYWCQNEACKNQGNHYIALDDSEIECHNCKTKHKVRPAMGRFADQKIPVRDAFGNFFRASELV
ncbi:hypothetical protein [Paenibacillus sinopodophylli]|uniref:hypothetical protein n=1 Tax=Paenibacillus sinopodophylli TaxID=1837342 RepID=UPI00110D1939|nr:hypothetical protein [Paenibacillus sinopodophylli]